MNNNFDTNQFKKLILKTKNLTNISVNLKVPKIISNIFRTQTELDARNLLPSKFDTLDEVFEILRLRFLDIKNSLSDINKAIDRNNLRIDELDTKKNDKISFSAYSDNYTNPDPKLTNIVLKKSIIVNDNEVIGVIADENQGIEFTEHLDTGIPGKSFIKIGIDDSKLDGINFITSSSVKIEWNAKAKAYEILQNDSFVYHSAQPEKEITINHNLGTVALDVKIFKYDPKDLELRYPIMPGIEYPSNNQVKIYLTSNQLVSVLITRI